MCCPSESVRTSTHCSTRSGVIDKTGPSPYARLPASSACHIMTSASQQGQAAHCH